jgi:hypothetical protein
MAGSITKMIFFRTSRSNRFNLFRQVARIPATTDEAQTCNLPSFQSSRFTGC